MIRRVAKPKPVKPSALSSQARAILARTAAARQKLSVSIAKAKP